MVVGGIRSHGGIGQVPHIAVETVHNRQTHRGTGRQIVDGQQHIVLMVLDIRTHAAQRAGVIVRAQRRIIMVAQNGAVLPDHQASADRHSRSQQHNDYGTEPTAQFQQFPTRADPNHQHDRHNRADRHTVETARRAKQRADREIRHDGNDRDHRKPAILRNRENTGQQRGHRQIVHTASSEPSPVPVGGSMASRYLNEPSIRIHPCVNVRSVGMTWAMVVPFRKMTGPTTSCAHAMNSICHHRRTRERDRQAPRASR